MSKPLQPSNNFTVEPITLETARLHLRLDTEGSPPTHPDDNLVQALISVAREAAEQYTASAIVQQDYTLALDAFPDKEISLGIWPVNSVASVTYKDPDGATQTLASADYGFDNFSRPARLYLQPNKTWPPTAIVPNAVTVQFNAGFTDEDSPNPYPLPKAIKQAMLLLIGHLYENREAVTSMSVNAKEELPMGAAYLLTPHRIKMGL